MKKLVLWVVIGVCALLVIVSGILLYLFRCNIFGHEYDTVECEVSCTEDGYKEHICTICNDRYKDEVVIAKGHKYADRIIKGSCTENGYIVHTCIACNESYREETAPKGHNYVLDHTTATCYEAGVETYSCSECKNMITKDVDAYKQHSFKRYASFSATCTGQGLWKYECSTCDEKKVETKPATGHRWNGDKCLNCGNVNPDYICKRLVDTNNKKLFKVYLYSGELTVNCSYTGTGNFIIELLDDNQDLVELICNEIGSYVVDKTVDVKPGWYYIEMYVSSGSYSWQFGKYYWEWHLGQNAIKDFRNAHPDEICCVGDLWNYVEEIGLPIDVIEWDELYADRVDGYFSGAAHSSDEERATYFIERGFSRDAIIKWFTDYGGYWRDYTYAEAAEMVDKCLKG